MGAKGSKEVSTDAERREKMAATFEKIGRTGGFWDKVDHVTTQELASLDPSTFVLVDVRPGPLRKVSHIPGSITQSEYESRKGEFDNKTVVTSW